MNNVEVAIVFAIIFASLNQQKNRLLVAWFEAASHVAICVK